MIKFQKVSKYFGDENYALQEVSFEIQPGELVLLTGPSGSGKTTIMRLLTREYKPSEGEIYLEDLAIHKVKKSRLHHLRRKIGVVFQDYLLLPELNVWENIALPLSIIGQKQSEIEQRVTDLLNLVKLPEKAKLFPRQLSGGEAQRISIARALAIGPEVIFADEPTGNLDPATSLSIASLLKKIQELGTTVIFATHDTGVLSFLSGQREIHLENGKVTIDTNTTKKKPKAESNKPEKKKPDNDSSNDKGEDKGEDKPEPKVDVKVEKLTDDKKPEVKETKKEVKKEK
jgi:cell division transport system ATP-binding protein